MSKILAAIALAYRKAVDHLTKLLGLIGAGIMWGAEALSNIDPDSIMAAATRYLRDEHWIKWVGGALFVLVFARGLWTGKQVKKLKAALAAAAPPPGSPQ